MRCITGCQLIEGYTILRQFFDRTSASGANNELPVIRNARSVVQVILLCIEIDRIQCGSVPMFIYVLEFAAASSVQYYVIGYVKTNVSRTFG